MKRYIRSATISSYSLEDFEKDCLNSLKEYVFSKSKHIVKLGFDVCNENHFADDSSYYYFTTDLRMKNKINYTGYPDILIGYFTCMYYNGHVMFFDLYYTNPRNGRTKKFVSLGDHEFSNVLLKMVPVDNDFGPSVQYVFESHKEDVERFVRFIDDQADQADQSPATSVSRKVPKFVKLPAGWKFMLLKEVYNKLGVPYSAQDEKDMIDIYDEYGLNYLGQAVEYDNLGLLTPEHDGDIEFVADVAMDPKTKEINLYQFSRGSLRTWDGDFVSEK